MSDYENIDQPRYGIKEISDAVDVPANTARTWLQRGHVLGGDLQFQGVDRVGRSGFANSFSVRRVYQFAIIAELNRLSVSPNLAGRAALLFTDQPNSAKTIDGTNWPAREPGRLFVGGKTILVATGDKKYPGRILFDNGSMRVGKLFTRPGSGVLGGAIAVIDLSTLINRVRGDLGLEPKIWQVKIP